MGVTADQIAKVPAGNLHVSREAFGQMWAHADELGSRPGTGLYTVGVLFTCEWLANQPLWSKIVNKMEIPASPVTRRHYAAMPETIQDEFIAAARACRPGQVGRRVELARGALATLEWTWHGSGRPPLELPATVTR